MESDHEPGDELEAVSAQAASTSRAPSRGRGARGASGVEDNGGAEEEAGETGEAREYTESELRSAVAAAVAKVEQRATKRQVRACG